MPNPDTLIAELFPEAAIPESGTRPVPNGLVSPPLLHTFFNACSGMETTPLTRQKTSRQPSLDARPSTKRRRGRQILSENTPADISELWDALFDLQDEMAELRDEIRSLKEKNQTLQNYLLMAPEVVLLEDKAQGSENNSSTDTGIKICLD